MVSIRILFKKLYTWIFKENEFVNKKTSNHKTDPLQKRTSYNSVKITDYLTI